MKTSCYANKTCLPILKKDQIKNIHTTDKDDLKEDFSNFKNLMINEFLFGWSCSADFRQIVLHSFLIFFVFSLETPLLVIACVIFCTELMKYSFFKEVNSFKKQLLETSEIDPTRIQSQTDNTDITSILERLIVQLQDQVSTLKNQLDRKDKVINTLLEKL